MATTPSVITREAGTSAPTTRPARRRLSLSHLLIAATALLAFALNYLALQNRDATTTVAVADTAIAEGTALTPDLVRFAALPADFEGLEHLIDEDELAGTDGWVAGRSLAAGQLIDRSVLVRPGSGDGLRTMSLPVPIEHAAGGTVVVGDRVDVISIVGEEPAFVATDLEVVGIADASQSGLSGVGPYYVVVAVTPDDAIALARAVESTSIEVLRATGAGDLPVDGE